ncbi:MAG: hypothetical protein Q8885_00575 [Candidatus Phytoplasma stylosanthis]|nr:hypothetical protein [Candidatus Phytoplasma stylosanthis]
MIFKIKGRYYKIIPFIYIAAILIFCFLFIMNASFQYHLEAENRRTALNKDIKVEFRKINNDIYQENKALKKENEQLEVHFQTIFNRLKDFLNLENKNLKDRLEVLEKDFKRNFELLKNELNVLKTNTNYEINDLETKIEDFKRNFELLTNKFYPLKPLKTDVKNLKIDVKQLKTDVKNIFESLECLENARLTTNQKEITTPPILETKPYIKYYDSEGNTIREYRFFKNMHPTQKDINGRTVFFDKQAFQDCLNKIGISCYPIQWSHGRDYLGEYELDSDGIKKIKYLWAVSKSNYQFIQTNKPDVTTELLTKDSYGVREDYNINNFYNESWCFLNTCRNIDIFKTFSEEIDSEKMPYLRLITKNLELEFDWLKFITYEFENYCSYKFRRLFKSCIYNFNALKEYINNLSPNDFKAFQVLHRLNNIDSNKFHDNYQYNLYFQYNRQDLIHWLNNLDLKNDKRLIKIREWAIYNMEQEQKQQDTRI